MSGDKNMIYHCQNTWVVTGSPDGVGQRPSLPWLPVAI